MNKYSSYKNSGVEWIGEIPSHYNIIRLKYLCDVSTGSRDTQDKVDDGEYPFFVRSPQIERINSYSFDGESVLTVGDGVGTGKVFHYFNGKFEYHQRVYKFSGFRLIKGKFFYWFMLHHFIYVTEDQNSKSTVDSLRRPLIDNFWFVVPPISEQQQIVSYLDRKTLQIDTLIEKTQWKIKLLKEKRTSLINEVLTKGLNPDVEMKDSGVEWIGEIPSHWVVSKFKYDTSIPVQYGINISGDKYNEEGIRFIRITDISENGELNPYDGKYLNPEDVPDEFLLKKFDVLFCRSGHTVGKTYLHYFDGLYTFGGYLVRFNFRNYFESKFIFYISKTDFYWDWIKLNTVVSTIENVNGDKYQNFVYPKPALSEQQQIVSYLDEQTQLIDKTVSIEERRIGLLKEYRQSLISEAVTGKIKVTTYEQETV